MRSVSGKIDVASDGVLANGIGFPILDWLGGTHDEKMFLIALYCAVTGTILKVFGAVLKYLYYRLEKKRAAKQKL